MNPEPATGPTISIYQRPIHVAGILQQAHASGLPVTESRESHADDSAGVTSGMTAAGEGTVSGAIAFVGTASVGLSGAVESTEDHTQVVGNRSSQQFEYSQAFYVYTVRRALIGRGLVKQVGSREAAETLKPGDFVEFYATFDPSQLHALLDILTPELISAMFYYRKRSEGVAGFSAYSDYDSQMRYAAANDIEARTQADLAQVVARAIRVDFRSEGLASTSGVSDLELTW
jgi:hypothetical protein